MSSAFSPAPLLGNRHVQTMWSAVARPIPEQSAYRERWTLPDGEPIGVKILPAASDVAPVALVLHGLEGSSDSAYVACLLQRLSLAGYRAAAFDFRTCGPVGPAARSFYHAGRTDDVAFVAARLRERWPAAPLVAIGFSMGANMLGKWLGETGDDSPLACAAMVSAPYDLAQCVDVLDGAGVFPWLYRERFLQSLRMKALRLAEGEKRLDVDRIRRCRTFAEYDGHVITTMFGFPTARDYWEDSGCGRFLPRIRRKTLVMSAEDDPICPGSSIPHATVAANPLLQSRFSPKGGHVGFVAGSVWRPKYDADEEILAFFAKNLDFDNPLPSPLA